VPLSQTGALKVPPAVRICHWLAACVSSPPETVNEELASVGCSGTSSALLTGPVMVGATT